ncbi:flavin-binding monooxygenase-like domain-containing protein [Phthorimaea operculella]|nr:flavin-binding monooxygenase-like domain-containing protein [Phthorimaea operculella]
MLVSAGVWHKRLGHISYKGADSEYCTGDEGAQTAASPSHDDLSCSSLQPDLSSRRGEAVSCAGRQVPGSVADTSRPAPNTKRVCVIGAGIAGLTATKYLKEEDLNFTVLEASKYIGGTWRYDPRVGVDELNQPIHTSMYKHLRTNLPKPTMELGDFPLPKDYPSFPTRQNYYDYLLAYAKHHDLEKHIQFLHLVTSVRRVNDIWKVKHTYIPTGEEFEQEFDYVLIGSGHHSRPNMPDIPGENIFEGTIIHSHDYRVPDHFKDRRVLIVGAGPSGWDISLDVATVSRTLVKFNTPFPENYIKKPDVKEFNETGVIFVDGTYEDIDDVIFCTGFQYYYPFLDETSGLTIDKRSVVPLYKYMVNINQPSMIFMGLVVRACLVVAIEAQPSMIFMGLVVRACLVVAIEAQTRYATALVKGNFTLPSQEKMMEEWQKRADEIQAKGRPMSDIHLLANDEDKYYESLTEESGIYRVPPVFFKIRAVDTQAKLDNLYTYRNYEYTVLDDETFTRHMGSRCTNYINSTCAP